MDRVIELLVQQIPESHRRDGWLPDGVPCAWPSSSIGDGSRRVSSSDVPLIIFVVAMR